MKINKLNLTKWNRQISTLNFVLCFVGYPLVTSLFMPFTSDAEGASRIVTVPFRAFCLLITLLVFTFNCREKVKINSGAIALILYWVLLLMRMFYDLELRADVNVDPGSKSQAWLYALIISLLTMLSIISSYRQIDLNKSLHLMWQMLLLTIVLSVLSNPMLLAGSDEINERFDGNIALNTITFGQTAVTSMVLSCYLFFERKKALLFKIVLVICFLIAGVVMIRAGSRGPILSFLILIALWVLAKGRNLMIGIILLFFFGGILFFFQSFVNELIAEISPVMAARLQATIDDGDSGGRDVLYQDAIEHFIESPIVGKQFATFNSDGTLGYSHNLFLDAFRGLGVIGGFIMIFFIFKGVIEGYKLMKKDRECIWVILIIFQPILLSMTSGAFYSTPSLSVGLMFLFMYFKYKEGSFEDNR